MIRPLRKRHRFIWLILFVVISTLFIKSYRPPDKIIQTQPGSIIDSKGFIKSLSATGPNYDARLGTLKSGEKVLLLQIKSLFRSPAPGVYLTKEDAEDMMDFLWLGDINKTGNYRFTFNTGDSYHLVVYDPIKRRKIETFNFQ